jgi:hypothetical protein
LPLLTNDPLTQLAFSIYENKGVFALLLGSGLSRAADIPTGWEITLDLIRRVGLARDVDEQPDWAAWYREAAGDDPNYSALLEELASSPQERRAILHRYIEPSDDDLKEGRKVPTPAHHAIAALVQGGYVRVMVTTNFDRLMENALRERGVEPTVVASVDALAGAEPLTHTACYILKLHGDYKDARILNTESELSGYPAQYDNLLDRIIDEHGMIVCGWSGEWDHALRAAFLRAPNRRYSMFWAARGTPGDGAQQLIEHRKARVIPITDANTFFKSLQQRVVTLEQSQRQNPLSIEILVNSTKRFLAKPEHRIQLDELLAEETDRLIARLDSSEFAMLHQWKPTEFRARVQKYEAATEALATMCGVLGRWGDDTEFPLVCDIIRSLYAQSEKIAAGLTYYVNLRSYPAVLVFTAYGLGLTRAARWRSLHSLFDFTVDQQYREPLRAIETLFLWAWKGTENDAWKQIEGLEQRRTPLSDHLFELFSEGGKRFAGLTPDFELMFERFEVLGSLAFLERNDKASLQQTLSSAARDFTWMPIGRASWHGANARKLIGELESSSVKTALTENGFGSGDPEFVDLFIANFKRMMGRAPW